MVWPSMELVSRAIFLLATAALALAGLALLGFVYTLHPLRYVSRATPADLGWPFESISLRTRDGLVLKGWYIPRAGGSDAQRAIIVLHGYPFDKGNILGVTRFLHDQFDLLLFDFRYFGESEGSFSTVGHRERLDLLAAVEYLRARRVAAIGVWGFSLGASAALLALPETDSIHALVADSAYADLRTMAMDYYRLIPVANHLLALYTDLLSRVFIGVWPSEVAPARAVQATRVPILVIHGAADATIPPHHFQRIREALADNPAAEFWLLDGVDHGLTYAMGREAYEARVLAFFQRHLKPATGGDAPDPLVGKLSF